MLENGSVKDSSSNNLSHESGFEWSLKPYVIFMKIFLGIQADYPSTSSKKIGRFCFTFYACTLLLLNAIFNVFYVNQFYHYRILNVAPSTLSNQPTPVQKSVIPNSQPSMQNQPEVVVNRNVSYSKTDYISLGIDMVNQVSSLFGIHLCFFVISIMTSRSKHLWDCFLQIQRQLELTDALYRRIRKAVLRGFFLLILDISANILLATALARPEIGNTPKSIVVAMSVSHVWTSIIMIWLFILICTAIYLFDELEVQIQAINKEANKSTSKLIEDLKTWKRDYSLVSHLVKEINRCFGSVLLVAVTYAFVTFITNFYQFITGVQSDGSPGFPYLFNFLKGVIFLSIFIISAYRLQVNGAKIADTVFKIELVSDLETLNIWNTIYTQVTHSDSKITAMGLFNVDLSLFPSLVGTTLTYVIILLQTN